MTKYNEVADDITATVTLSAEQKAAAAALREKLGIPSSDKADLMRREQYPAGANFVMDLCLGREV